MTPVFNELEISYYNVTIYEDEIDASLFEAEPSYACGHFDQDTIDLLKEDKFATAG